MHPALIVVYALAVARLTRLVGEDRITEAPRARLTRALWLRSIPAADVEARRLARGLASTARDALAVRRVMAHERLVEGADPPLSVYLLSCPWCISVYVGAAVAPLAYWWGDRPWLLVPALALTFSYVTGFLAGKE